MMKYVVAMLCGVALSGTVYMAGWGAPPAKETATAAGDECELCTPSSEVLLMSAAAAPASAPATAKASTTDAGNTKCLVSGEAIGSMGAGKTVDYKGKTYHLCCQDCVGTCNKDPEKFVKLLEADPAKYGVKK